MLFAAAKSSSSPVILILIVVVYIAVYYFFLRPRMRRTRASRQTTRQFEVGDRVQTIGGIIGTVTEMDDHTVTLRGVDGALQLFLRQAIAQRYVDPTIPTTPTATEGDGKTEGDAH